MHEEKNEEKDKRHSPQVEGTDVNGSFQQSPQESLP